MSTIVYLARQNEDMTEGRGPMRHFAAFSTEEAAQMAVKGKGVMGVGDGDVKPLIVYDSLREYLSEKEDAARKIALGKLTPEEKVLLGIS